MIVVISSSTHPAWLHAIHILSKMAIHPLCMITALSNKLHITKTSPSAIGNFREWLLYKFIMSLYLIVIQTNVKFLKITVTWTNIW